MALLHCVRTKIVETIPDCLEQTPERAEIGTLFWIVCHEKDLEWFQFISEIDGDSSVLLSSDHYL